MLRVEPGCDGRHGSSLWIALGPGSKTSDRSHICVEIKKPSMDWNIFVTCNCSITSSFAVWMWYLCRCLRAWMPKTLTCIQTMNTIVLASKFWPVHLDWLLQMVAVAFWWLQWLVSTQPIATQHLPMLLYLFIFILFLGFFFLLLSFFSRLVYRFCRFSFPGGFGTWGRDFVAIAQLFAAFMVLGGFGYCPAFEGVFMLQSCANCDLPAPWLLLSSPVGSWSLTTRTALLWCKHNQVRPSPWLPLTLTNHSSSVVVCCVLERLWVSGCRGPLG